MENTEYYDELELFGPLTVGDSVPNFEFKTYHENKIKPMTMEETRGKWLVLFFYPSDFTFVCPTELEDLEKLYKDFQNEGAEVISVSTDTVFVHKAWHDTSDAIGTITYPMAADPTHELSHAFGVHVADEGVALRGTFVIDPEGIIRVAEIHDNSIGRNVRETLRKIQAAKFVAEHDGKVCPSNWNPGDDTLEPGLDLVGKI
ncbi:peroxiredoxin [Candidatus Kaiserbacteria bacterium]|nr:MAG: peroxiredoxin [Candidatus Kaiserbacteria bacterium]PCI90359.1 MAG: peroxiredoxin [Candidatus Kaiserbacteria bacterium]